MAFSLKYIIQSTSDYFGKIDLIITANNYSGDVIELDAAGRDWIKLSIGGNSEDIGDVVLPSTLEFKFYVKDDFKTIEFGNSEPLSYRVEVRRADPSGVGFRIIWRGWINPELYSEDYQNTPYVAYVNASCGLEYLKNIKYDLVGVKKSLLEQIIYCLEQVQNNNNIFESINIYDTLMANGDNDSPLVQAKVNNSTYFDIGDDVSCYDVLTAILRPFFARIYLYEGWRIENIDGKKSSYVVRRYSYQGSGMIYTFLFSFIFDPLKELDNSPSGFKSFINKSGNLQFKPSINNTEIYFKTSQPDGNLILRGFSNDDDWLNNTTPKDWIIVNNIPTSKFEINLSNNQYAVRILGKNSSFENNQYIESKKLELNKDNFQNLNIGFKYFMNYPAIILLGSKPILYVEVYLVSSESSSIFYYNNGWSNLPKPMRIDATGRLFYFNWNVNIDTIPESGDLYIRIHRLVKKGDTGNTELRITEFTANLSVGEMPTNLVLKEIGSSGIQTNYIGPSFEHYISDGQVVDRNGVLDVGNVLTSSWSRRGKTDNLNLRRLYILQWLSMLQKPTSVLSGTVLIKNEEINPLSVIKDKDSVRDTRYIMTSWNVSLSTGIGDVSYRELPLTDANVGFTVEQVTQDEIKDLYPDFTIRDGIGFNTGTGSGSTTNNTATTINVTPLNGDVSGEISTAILNPSAIVNKETIPLTGQLSSRIVLNAVEDSEDQENMTKTSVKDLFGSWTEKTTTVNNDKLVIIDSQDNGELKTVTKANLGIKDKFIDLIDTPSTYTGQQNKLPIVNSGQNGLIFTNLKTINSESIIGDGGITIPTHDAVTIGTANGLSLSNQILSLGLASSSTNGALSATDWNTFNTKIGGTIASGQVAFGTGAGTIGGNIGLVWDNVNKNLFIGNNNTPSLTLQSTSGAGGVGNPFVELKRSTLVGLKLEYFPNLTGRISATAADSGILEFWTGANTLKWSILASGILQSNGAQTIQTSGTESLTLQGNGGTTIIGSGLTVNGLSGGSNSIIYATSTGVLTKVTIGTGLSFNDGTLTATGGATGTVTGSGTSGYIARWSSASNIVNSIIFDNGTNVGIGTTNPSKKLEIQTPNGVESAIRIRQLSQNFWDIYSPESSTALAIGDVSGEKMRITSTGNVGVGTTNPVRRLDIDSTTFASLRITRDGGVDVNTNFEIKNLTTSWYVGANGSNFHIGTDPDISVSNLFRITSTGNVGIGTILPNEKIHVVGNGLIFNQTGGLLTIGDGANELNTTSTLVLGRIGDVRNVQLRSVAKRALSTNGRNRDLEIWTDNEGVLFSHSIFRHNGNVLIGTTTDLTGLGRLQVNGNLNIATVANATGDFLTHVNGIVNKRTPAEVITDIGALPSSRTLTINGTSNQVTVSPTGAQDLTTNRTWTLSLPQNIHTGASPTFGGLTVNGNILIRAVATTFETSHIPVFTSDPSTTTRQLGTKTPAQLRTDIGAIGKQANAVTPATTQADRIWVGSQADYNSASTVKSNDVIYFII
jgi:hypothetical protein